MQVKCLVCQWNLIIDHRYRGCLPHKALENDKMQLYHKEHIIFFKTPLCLTEPLRELPESHFSALDKKNNLLQFKNVLTPERRGYKGTLLKFTPRLPLQLHFLQ